MLLAVYRGNMAMSSSARFTAFAIVLISVSVLLYRSAASIVISANGVHDNVVSPHTQGLREGGIRLSTRDLAQGRRVFRRSCTVCLTLSESDDSAWDECFHRGEALLCLSSPGMDPAASPYQDYTALRRWGWTIDLQLPLQPPPLLPLGAVTALQGLGLSTGLNKNIYAGLSQNNVFTDSNGVEQVRLNLFRLARRCMLTAYSEQLEGSIETSIAPPKT